MQDVKCHVVLVANYAKVVEANTVIIFRICVLAHQRTRPQVAVLTLLQLAARVIQFKALELLGTKHLLSLVNFSYAQ